MGRVKLKIKRLENTNGRQATYAKRKNGIMKKANELSILCDIDIILLMFSPTGKPSLCNGKHSFISVDLKAVHEEEHRVESLIGRTSHEVAIIEEVIAKFAQLTPQERAKRKLESLEALKKTFKKLDHDVNIQDFLGTSTQAIEDLTSQARLLQTQLSEIYKRLSYWTKPEKINSMEHLGQMEDLLRESLNQIQTRKENLGTQQLMSLESTGQFQNGMHIPFRMGVDQQFQPPSWIPNNDSQHMVLPEDPNLLPQRDMECPASSSFGSYSGYFGVGKNSEIANSGEECGVLNELSTTTSLRLQLGGQYPYTPYNPNLPSNTKFQPAAEMNLQENHLDYHVDGGFEAPQPGFDTTHGSWASTSETCSVAMFDEHIYSQQPN